MFRLKDKNDNTLDRPEFDSALIDIWKESDEKLKDTLSNVKSVLSFSKEKFFVRLKNQHVSFDTLVSKSNPVILPADGAYREALHTAFSEFPKRFKGVEHLLEGDIATAVKTHEEIYTVLGRLAAFDEALIKETAKLDEENNRLQIKIARLEGELNAADKKPKEPTKKVKKEGEQESYIDAALN